MHHFPRKQERQGAPVRCLSASRKSLTNPRAVGEGAHRDLLSGAGGAGTPSPAEGAKPAKTAPRSVSRLSRAASFGSGAARGFFFADPICWPVLAAVGFWLIVLVVMS